MKDKIPQVWLTGDKHGEIDMSDISTKAWPEQRELIKEDYLIVLGDFGLLWKNRKDRTEEYLTKWYNDKKCTTLFVDGNHENHARLMALPRVEMFGGIVGKVSDSIYHLKRGEVYTIAGKKFFVFGGALSIDKENRTEWTSWWKEEIPNHAECEHGLDTLEKHENKVDYILTHTCPKQIKEELLGKRPLGNAYIFEKFNDPTTDYLDRIVDLVEFESFHFGHFHTNKKMGKYNCYYDLVERLI